MSLEGKNTYDEMNSVELMPIAHSHNTNVVANYVFDLIHTIKVKPFVVPLQRLYLLSALPSTLLNRSVNKYSFRDTFAMESRTCLSVFQQKQREHPEIAAEDLRRIFYGVYLPVPEQNKKEHALDDIKPLIGRLAEIIRKSKLDTIINRKLLYISLGEQHYSLPTLLCELLMVMIGIAYGIAKLFIEQTEEDFRLIMQEATKLKSHLCGKTPTNLPACSETDDGKKKILDEELEYRMRAVNEEQYYHSSHALTYLLLMNIALTHVDIVPFDDPIKYSKQELNKIITDKQREATMCSKVADTWEDCTSITGGIHINALMDKQNLMQRFHIVPIFISSELNTKNNKDFTNHCKLTSDGSMNLYNESFYAAFDLFVYNLTDNIIQIMDITAYNEALAILAIDNRGRINPEVFYSNIYPLIHNCLSQ